MGKTAALRITQPERKAFFKRREQTVGEEFAARRAGRAKRKPEEARAASIEAGFSPLGKALDRGWQ